MSPLSQEKNNANLTGNEANQLSDETPMKRLIQALKQARAEKEAREREEAALNDGNNKTGKSENGNEDNWNGRKIANDLFTKKKSLA